MKQIHIINTARRYFGKIAAFALVGVMLSGLDRSAQAGEVNTQTAEILALLSAVHELTSYNGDPAIRDEHFAVWRELWAEDATFVINGTVTHTGRDAIMNFFAGAAFFNQNWVGLAPTFRTEIDIHGNTAEVYIECIFLDESKSIVAERSLSGTIRKINGNWRFWRVFNDPAQPLF